MVQFPRPGRLQVSTLTVSPPPKPELFVVGMHFSSRLAPVSGTKLPGLVSRYTRICTCPAVTAAGRRLPAWEKSTFGPLKCCKDLRGGSKTVCEIIIFFAPYKTSRVAIGIHRWIYCVISRFGVMFLAGNQEHREAAKGI